MDMAAVLEQEQEEGGQVVKRVITYASKTLSASQRCYCTTNKELLVVVIVIDLFKYYLTGHHFMVVTDQASLTWLRNFKELEGVGSSRLILTTCISLANTIAMQMGCLAGFHIPANTKTPCEQYMEDFDGYIELVEDDSTLFRDPTAPVPSPLAQAIPPELLWYMGHHPAKEGGTSSGGSPSDNAEWTAISRAKVIEQLLDADSCHGETQPGDFCIPIKGDCSDSGSLPSRSKSE